MRISRYSFLALSLAICFCKPAQSQEQKEQPFIISVIPDSLLENYDYSQVFSFYVVASEYANPTETMEELSEKIVEKCEDDKFDGFLLQHTTFFNHYSLVAWGALLRRK